MYLNQTSTSKKKRKSDVDPSGAESEDNVRRERTELSLLHNVNPKGMLANKKDQSMIICTD